MNKICCMVAGLVLGTWATGSVAQVGATSSLSTVTSLVDSRVRNATAELVARQIKAGATLPWQPNARLLKGERNVFIRKDGTEKVVDGTDVITRDLRAPKGVSAPCDADRASWSLPNPDARDFYARHQDITGSVAAVIAWLPDLGAWQLVGTSALVRSDTLVTARHVAEAAVGLNPLVAGATATVREAWIVFDVSADKFPDGIPARYDPTKDANAVRIAAGSKAVVPNDVTLDLAFVSVPKQDRRSLSIDTAPLGNKAGLAVVGVPGKPQGDDATDYRIPVFSVCGQPDTAWPVAIRIATGSYVGLDSDPRVIRFAVSTLGGDSGAMLLDLGSGAVVGVTIGSALRGSTLYNLGVTSKEISVLLATL